ncbi:MAG: ComEC/Rec2 family competence protein [Marinovum algicola]|uniref:ComEC/Rec2 family competence protein n=1 Tax=Roseobacteraceae TaxID=2854170 RepID=UPI0032ED5105
MELVHSAVSAWLAQRGQLFCWAPVALAAGVGLYFAVKVEPAPMQYLWIGGGAVLCLGLAARAGVLVSPVLWGVALVALGFCIAGARAHWVKAPVLTWRYYGPVEGRIVGLDRSGSDALRLTLDQVVLARVSPSRTPARVRVSLHGVQGHLDPAPGMRVILTGHLSPPAGPVEPAGFDFQRHAWFKRLGAVGYTRTPVLLLEPAGGGQWLFKARMWLSDRVQARVPGETGAFAAAIMTGDRSGIGQDTLKALRISNLAHLLAISGLHLGLLAGVVFGAVRLGFAAVPYLGLRLPAKKIAAGVAVAAAAGYYSLSGGNVATERAFVMVAVMLFAVMADRRALSLRAVAMAALIVLVLRPEAMLGPGFQMSFAATTALVAVFGWFRDREISLGPRWLRPAVAVAVSSLVAGLATAPIAAAHFNQVAHYGLPANLLSVPLMGVLVMPAALVSVCLLPFGLEWLPLWLMGQGLGWILGVAHWISGLEGARGTVPGPGPAVLPLIAVGALLLILWQGRFRVAGLVPAALGALLWVQTGRPDVLISDTGALVGVMTEKGRALSKPRGAGFVADIWLENDGDPEEQEAAHDRWGDVAGTGWPVIALPGKRAAEALTTCRRDDWIVLTAAPTVELPCRVITPETLRATGAIALFDEGGKIRQVTAREVTGARLWNTQ